MDHAITLGDVLMVGGIGLGLLILVLLGIAFLNKLGSGWNH